MKQKTEACRLGPYFILPMTLSCVGGGHLLAYFSKIVLFVSYDGDKSFSSTKYAVKPPRHFEVQPAFRHSEDK